MIHKKIASRGSRPAETWGPSSFRLKQDTPWLMVGLGLVSIVGGLWLSCQMYVESLGSENALRVFVFPLFFLLTSLALGGYLCAVVFLCKDDFIFVDYKSIEIKTSYGPFCLKRRHVKYNWNELSFFESSLKSSDGEHLTYTISLYDRQCKLIGTFKMVPFFSSHSLIGVDKFIGRHIPTKIVFDLKNSGDDSYRFVFSKNIFWMVFFGASALFFLAMSFSVYDQPLRLLIAVFFSALMLFVLYCIFVSSRYFIVISRKSIAVHTDSVDVITFDNIASYSFDGLYGDEMTVVYSEKGQTKVINLGGLKERYAFASVMRFFCPGKCVDVY